MENMNHTPEPWEVAGRAIFAEKKLVVTAPWSEKSEKYQQGCVNVRRIVACVNACAGIDTETLETGTVTGAVQMAIRHSAEAKKMKVVAENLYDALTVCKNLLIELVEADKVGIATIKLAQKTLLNAQELMS